ncbi:MAG: radical SAM protein, partial [Bdellovibrionota bacterium]
METDLLTVTEIFHSIQGETSLAGVRFAFIRLTGCNLRCSYCDTAYAFHEGKNMRIDEILSAIKPFEAKHILVTGGEPLIQQNTPILLKALSCSKYIVSIETNGELPINTIGHLARVIMDIKTPASGMSRGGFRKNLPLLKHGDEIKFIITSEDDYLWAKDLVLSGDLPPIEILFSPATKSLHKWLAEKIIDDLLPVRFQLQLHKLIWGISARGV